MKVLVTDKINESAGDIIKEVANVDFLPTMTEDELAAKIGEYDALMVRSQTKVTPKIIEAGKNLKIIGRAGVGVDNIDVDAATQKGIIVVNSPDGNTTAAAEHTVALMLAMARNISPASQSTKEGKWERTKFTGTELSNKSLGIIGLGKIGSHVAKVALALGMKLFVYDPFTSKESVEKLGGTYVGNLDDFWGKVDFISLHVPKTKDTMNLINKDTIAKMKKGVRIVNCARGGIINEADLKDALESGQVAAAAIDVFENEPDIATCPLLKTNANILLTPHLGASTEEAQVNVAIDVAQQIKEVLSGGSAKAAVNIPSLKPEILEPVKEYMPLAVNLGEVAAQLSTGGVQSIEITATGKLAELNVSPLEVAVLKGVLSHQMEGVNYVNAPIFAKKRGIAIVTSSAKKAGNYKGAIKVTITTDKETNIVMGAVIAEDIARIVRMNDYEMSVRPQAHMLIVPHENKLSMIAKVATVMGENGINVSSMTVVQKVADNANDDDGVSMMIINTDVDVDEKTLKLIEKIDGVRSPKYLKLVES